MIPVVGTSFDIISHILNTKSHILKDTMSVCACMRACVLTLLKLISETFPESEQILLMNRSGILSKTLRLAGKRRSNIFLTLYLLIF